jgi:hypothetical protein
MDLINNQSPLVVSVSSTNVNTGGDAVLDGDITSLLSSAEHVGAVAAVVVAVIIFSDEPPTTPGSRSACDVVFVFVIESRDKIINPDPSYYYCSSRWKKTSLC